MASLQSVSGTIGDDTLTTDLIKDFVVDALDGDDTITVEETSSGVEIQAGKGEDKIVFSGDVSNSPKIKGGANADVFDFQGTVTASTVYGGKAGDSLKFGRTIEGSVISADTGSDTITVNNKIIGKSLIDGGEDDDLITINERITESTIAGGGAQDTIDINSNSESAVIKAGSANDVLTFDGKHGSLKAKGNGGDDTITVESGFTGSSNSFYGGKGEDKLVVETTAKVALYGGEDEDNLSVAADLASTGATLKEGDGQIPLVQHCRRFGCSLWQWRHDSLTGSDGLDTVLWRTE